MIDFVNARRRFTTAFGMVGVGLVLAGVNSRIVRATEKHDEDDDEDNDKEVGAVEDLMREHGVIRRVILVYRQAAAKLRANPASVDPNALRRTALLFRSFGEDYHEKKLEETHIFPAIKKAGIPAAAYVDILIAQHQRGREITDYVVAMAAKGAIGSGDAEPLARALESIELMYEHHAAREDTVVFPAWKDALTTRQLHEMSELFEEIEHQQFGEDGFGDAVAQIGKIEQQLGTADISLFTAPPPPKT
jgi:hemerythrin-like domain-containing protein